MTTALSAIFGDRTPVNDGPEPGFERFSNGDVMGVVRITYQRVELLDFMSTKPGTGKIRRFLTAMQKACNEIHILNIESHQIREKLRASGFRPETDGEAGNGPVFRLIWRHQDNAAPCACVHPQSGVLFRSGRPTPDDYDEAIRDLEAARKQTRPVGDGCAICRDSGHMAWNCHHNPLVMARRAVRNAKSWRCFQCDKLFTDYVAALQHFGQSPTEQPACIRSLARADRPSQTAENGT